MAIATCLLGKEFVAAFRDRERPEHWLRHLWHRMRGATIEDFKSNRVSIVTYNYDLLIECYFQQVLVGQYGITHDEAWNLFEEVTHITHLHGDLGDQACARGRPFTDGVANYSEVVVSARRLALLHGGAPKPYDRAARMIGEAQRLLFVGFGYHDVNLKRLDIPRAWRPDFEGRTIAGSTLGLSALREGELRESFRSSLGGLTFENHRVNAYAFLKEYV